MEVAPFVLAPLGFVTLWVLVCGLIAWIGGHGALLRAFPPQVDTVREFMPVSGRGPMFVRYNNALYVGIGEIGLHMAPIALFRPFWWWGIPCVPWDEVQVTVETNTGLKAMFVGTHVAEIGVARLALTWRLYGAVAVALGAREG